MPRLLICLCASTFSLFPFPCSLAVGAAEAQAPLTRAQQAEFLRTARIVKAVPIGKGVTRPFRLTLTDGATTHDAAFQSIDQMRSLSRGTGAGRSNEINFKDSWRFNVAAPRVAELIGIGDMVPVSVERTWESKSGALTWWVDDVLMDEEERGKTAAKAPDMEEWNRQYLRMRVFTQLVYDTDRNQGNILITKDWRIVMIDFTRAFRSWKETPNPLAVLRRCDRALLAGMKGMTPEGVRQAMDGSLTNFEVVALIARRDVIVKHFEGLIAQLGEARVLY